MKTILRSCAATVAVAAILPAAAAHAAPVTVTLRIEGPTTTLYEGPVTTDVRDFHFTGDSTPHICDTTAGSGGSGTTSVPTRGAALATAIDAGLDVRGTWGGFGATITSVAGTNLEYDADTGAYLGEYLNGTLSSLGACGEAINNGDDLLFAYASVAFPPPDFAPVPPTLLKLSGVPERLAPGATATAKVTDYLGQPIAGATVDGRTSAADGSVQIGPFTTTGPRVLKAEKPDTVRSNGGQVCVTDGADGACGTVKPIAAPIAAPGPGCVSLGSDGRCGTVDKLAPVAALTGLTAKSYKAADAPRELKGTAGDRTSTGELLADGSAIADVRARLTRRAPNGRCSTYSGKQERFVATKRCATSKARSFSVGKTAQWSYLLPHALEPGTYRLLTYAVDRAGHTNRTVRRGSNYVVFTVKG